MRDFKPAIRPDGAATPPPPPGNGQDTDDSSAQLHAQPAAAPLPPDENPPLPEEEVPIDDGILRYPNDRNDGWMYCYNKKTAEAWFYNSRTQRSQWHNPNEEVDSNHASNYRNAQGAALGTSSSTGAPGASQQQPRRIAGGYNPAIHGSYDPKADYAIEARKEEDEKEAAIAAMNAANAAAMAARLRSDDYTYTATGKFNRITGRFQNDQVNSENHNNDAKSHRQLQAYFDADKAANSHDGRSLKAERRNRPISKAEVREYNLKRKEKKEKKRRDFLLS